MVEFEAGICEIFVCCCNQLVSIDKQFQLPVAFFSLGACLYILYQKLILIVQVLFHLLLVLQFLPLSPHIILWFCRRLVYFLVHVFNILGAPIEQVSSFIFFILFENLWGIKHDFINTLIGFLNMGTFWNQFGIIWHILLYILTILTVTY